MTVTRETNGDVTIFFVHNQVGLHMNAHVMIEEITGEWPETGDAVIQQGPNGVSHLLLKLL